MIRFTHEGLGHTNDLGKGGYSIRFTHGYDHIQELPGNFVSLLPGSQLCEYRRYTLCEIVYGSDSVVLQGLAVCNTSDNFDKSYGRKLSLTRALNRLRTMVITDKGSWPITKSFRSAAWQAYFETCPLRKQITFQSR